MLLLTERLILREFVANDRADVLAYQSDPLYLRFYHWTGRTVEEVQQFVQMFLDQQQEQPRTKFQLAVILRGENQLIGNCGVRMEAADASEADIGFELAPERWGNGYATEAAQAIVMFGFAELHLHRIWAQCIADNGGSARVLEKLGMRQEGRLRENEWIKGRWRDTLIYGILDNEWHSRRS